MAISESLVTTWAPSILEVLQKNLVYSRLFNSDYEGEAAGGQSVRITAVSDVTINSHTRNTPITWEALTDSVQGLDIDQESYFAFMLDSLDKAQTKADFLGAATRNAIYGVKDEIDQYLVGLLAAAATITTSLGTSVTPLEINSANIGTTLTYIARLLDESDVPREKRAIVVPPFVGEDLVNANIADETNQDAISKNGQVATYAGLSVLVSNNVPNTAGEKYQVVAGSDIGATFALAVDEVEAMRLQDYIADGVRGIVAYGGKVTRPGAIALAYFNEAAEV